jgi:hypothetical protein
LTANTEVVEEPAEFYGRPLTSVDANFLAGLPQMSELTEAGVFKEQQFPYSSHCYVNVLLAHAKVYTFALYHFIESLQELALQRLTQTITRIDCRQPHAASELATLILYIYNNTVIGDFREDPARRLVSQFAALHFDDLVHDNFKDLLHKGDDFVTDVNLKVARRLNDLEYKVRELDGSEDPWNTFGTKKKRNKRR